MWFFGGVTSRSIVRRSFLNAAILAVHAFTSGGASDLGQYPSGHAAETYFELRLKSRISRWARRMCSSSIQAVCGKFATLTPASCRVQSPMASSKVMCAPPPFSKYRRWSRRDLSRRSDGLVVLEVRFLLELFLFMIPLAVQTGLEPPALQPLRSRALLPGTLGRSPAPGGALAALLWHRQKRFRPRGCRDSTSASV